ncbi:hypothetical protein PV326_000659 [Microctonus aethiopoides]|nr:hypothetical protein PV326_000659 [Microctonus aethiopoides]
MDRKMCAIVNPESIRLSTITEYSESNAASVIDESDDLNKRIVNVSEESNNFSSYERTALGSVEDKNVVMMENTKEQLEDESVEYFLFNDSPMARFTRSAKWAYKKVQ